jgi:hypothetical protein
MCGSLWPPCPHVCHAIDQLDYFKLSRKEEEEDPFVIKVISIPSSQQTQIGPPPNYLENDFETTLIVSRQPTLTNTHNGLNQERNIPKSRPKILKNSGK